MTWQFGKHSSKQRCPISIVSCIHSSIGSIPTQVLQASIERGKLYVVRDRIGGSRDFLASILTILFILMIMVAYKKITTLVYKKHFALYILVILAFCCQVEHSPPIAVHVVRFCSTSEKLENYGTDVILL